ncbi:MAG: GNAT family N-acetyltransferase [Solirubrobacteraceae bacterium]
MTDVQAYLRAAAAADRHLLATGPFDVFIDPVSDHPYLNYAIPRDGAEPTPESITEVVTVMGRAARTPRLEFLPAAAPAAEAALLEFGFTEQLRTPVMARTAEDDGADAPIADGVLLQQLGPDVEREQIAGFMRTRAEAFGEPYEPGGNDGAAATFTRRIAVVAYAEEEVVGGGMCLEALEGVVELVGIGVAEAFRRRGIGTAVTSELARLAFASGVEVAFLTPGNEDTRRVYERAGFTVSDEMLHLVFG